MSKTTIALFEQKKIRKIWHDNQWYFSVIDVIEVLTDSRDPRDYWYKMKIRVKAEDGFEPSTVCRQLKLLASDGKMRETDCSNTSWILRIIQSVPSPKAEPFKQWLAKVGSERIDEINNPELAQERMKQIFEEKWYSKEWINKRVRWIAVRQELTEEWSERWVKAWNDYAILTNEIMNAAFGMDVQTYKEYKWLDQQNLRDHMTDLELILTMLGEATTTSLHKKRDSRTISKLKDDAKDGGSVAGDTRKNIEEKLGEKVVTQKNYLDLTDPKPIKKKILGKKK